MKQKVSNNTNTETKTYIGLTENTFKQRYSNHKKDFTHEKYAKSTELSKYIWDLKRNNITPNITWKCIKKVNSTPKYNYCKLC